MHVWTENCCADLLSLFLFFQRATAVTACVWLLSSCLEAFTLLLLSLSPLCRCLLLSAAD